jgi:hypothetical protein
MKTIKALFGLFVVVAIVYLGVKTMPPYFANYQFEDIVDNEAKMNSYNQKTEQEIREGILKKAHDLEIPLTSEQVKVQRMGAELEISADYTVHIDIPVYPFDLHFTPSSKNKRI